ncbi:MAG: hypothetical protein A3B30_02610 [Candidatus Komeilibacteria bacterium RIFCSPLOWO2_01_FULL_52_15]|uniref:Glycosyltransferase RgtA/B/C/D-like domain-containing protein n=2 Tax=Candidatus Komeiliibacteriota TaxID=1817908 RepID=A0A1G2BQJ7_9BACT|nr:MAG: hypothetical protein A2677_01370 [Candidatus Komeilibacteria bacterium RIFCSPHIGHO2_01_FULL_52_14]OGY90620.1 MAG: hypothetical protein A3B30_02610 [Candidatus Komeilibacteria bacterium RIFCSPLOWO2_01_FULL_52_15]
MKRVFENYRIEIGLFLSSIILRAGFLLIAALRLQQPYQGFFTADGYYEIAMNLVSHDAYTITFQSPFILDTLRPPGLPYLIAVLFQLSGSMALFHVLQLIAASCIPVLAFWLAQRIGLTRKYAFMVALVILVDPLGIVLSLKVISETFFTALFLTGVLALCSFLKDGHMGSSGHAYALYAGGALGVATLFRPSVLYLAPALAVIWFAARYLQHKSLRAGSIALFLLCFYIFVSPWMIRNFRAYGAFAYSSIRQQVLYGALAPSVYAFAFHESYREGQQRLFAEDGLSEYPIISLGNAPYFNRRASQTIAAHPLAFAGVAAINTATFFTHDGVFDFLGLIGVTGQYMHLERGTFLAAQVLAHPTQVIGVIFSPYLFIGLVRFWWVIVALLFLAQIFFIFRKQTVSAQIFLFILIVLYFALTTIANGFAVNARFRFPVNALLVSLAMLSVQRLGRHFKRAAH